MPVQKAVWDSLYLKTFDKFASKLREGKTASLGVSFAEAHEALTLVRARAGSFFRLVRSLQRFDILGVYRELVLNPADRKRVGRILNARQRGKEWSGLLLELNFGWTPLIQDIYSAIDVLQSTPRAGSVGSFTKTRVAPWDLRLDEDGGRIQYGEHCEGEFLVRISGRSQVSNPNLALANQMGLVNPIQVAWDVIPLSFLVNWFVPVSAFLGSYSSMWGWDLSNLCISYLSSGTGVETSSSAVFDGPDYNYRVDSAGYVFQRVPLSSLPIPSLYSRVQLPHGHLLGKAASSVALLVQQLTQRK
jgi:hypothetical protein